MTRLQDPQLLSSFKKFQNYFSNLRCEEQAGFFVWPSLQSHTLTDHEKELFSTIKPSGVVLFKRHFVNVEQSKSLISEIRNACKHENMPFKTDFIVAVDEEGGRVSRLPLNFKTKPVLEFTRNHDKQGLKDQVSLQAHTAKELGVNCILAPVLDILTELQNTVIGDRSFGTTAEEVCEYAEIAYHVLEDAHIFSCAKHFPGHGNTTQDSHVAAAVSDVPADILRHREWLPFIHFIQKNIPMIMAAHVIVPQIDPNTPATLSGKILTDILRNELQFKGLILSDDLRMAAIKKYYETKGIDESYLAHACIDALYAGCDILLSCNSIVDEKIIVDAIVQKMATDKEFFNLCCEKAFRQTQLLSEHFKHEKKVTE